MDIPCVGENWGPCAKYTAVTTGSVLITSIALAAIGALVMGLLAYFSVIPWINALTSYLLMGGGGLVLTGDTLAGLIALAVILSSNKKPSLTLKDEPSKPIKHTSDEVDASDEDVVVDSVEERIDEEEKTVNSNESGDQLPSSLSEETVVRRESSPRSSSDVVVSDADSVGSSQEEIIYEEGSDIESEREDDEGYIDEVSTADIADAIDEIKDPFNKLKLFIDYIDYMMKFEIESELIDFAKEAADEITIPAKRIRALLELSVCCEDEALYTEVKTKEMERAFIDDFSIFEIVLYEAKQGKFTLAEESVKKITCPIVHEEAVWEIEKHKAMQSESGDFLAIAQKIEDKDTKDTALLWIVEYEAGRGNFDKAEEIAQTIPKEKEEAYLKIAQNQARQGLFDEAKKTMQTYLKPLHKDLLRLAFVEGKIGQGEIGEAEKIAYRITSPYQQARALLMILAFRTARV